MENGFDGRVEAIETKVLILGSGPNVVEARDWDLSVFDHVVAINNAWRVRPDWDFAICPEDFPEEARPPTLEPGQRFVEASDYVPIQNQYGGFVYAGGTMAFTAGYWALGALRPKVLAFLGCDMVYPAQGATHFYGIGAADPLRADPTLANLQAKAARLELLAATEGCACVNLSARESRLVFPRASLKALDRPEPCGPDEKALRRLNEMEQALGYVVPSGRYWEVQDLFDPERLAEIDAGWLALHAVTLKTEPAP